MTPHSSIPDKIKAIGEQNIDELGATLKIWTTIGYPIDSGLLLKALLRMAVLVKELGEQPHDIINLIGDDDSSTVDVHYGDGGKITTTTMRPQRHPADGSTADRDAANEVSTKRLNDELYGERR